jgi:hypothetical protein
VTIAAVWDSEGCRGWGHGPRVFINATSSSMFVHDMDGCSLMHATASLCLRSDLQVQRSWNWVRASPRGRAPSSMGARVLIDLGQLWPARKFYKTKFPKPKYGKRANSRDPFRWLTRVMDSFSGRRLPSYPPSRIAHQRSPPESLAGYPADIAVMELEGVVLDDSSAE